MGETFYVDNELQSNFIIQDPAFSTITSTRLLETAADTDTASNSTVFIIFSFEKNQKILISKKLNFFTKTLIFFNK